MEYQMKHRRIKVAATSDSRQTESFIIYFRSLVDLIPCAHSQSYDRRFDWMKQKRRRRRRQQRDSPMQCSHRNRLHSKHKVRGILARIIKTNCLRTNCIQVESKLWNNIWHVNGVKNDDRWEACARACVCAFIFSWIRGGEIEFARFNPPDESDHHKRKMLSEYSEHWSLTTWLLVTAFLLSSACATINSRFGDWNQPCMRLL